MTSVFDFKKLRRLINIYAVVQVVLVALLLYTSLQFQGGLTAAGRGDLFTKSIIYTLLMQLALFYPIYKFGSREAGLAVDSLKSGLTPAELKSLRNKRLVGDVVKSGVFCFYVVFIWKVPVSNAAATTFFLSIIFFNFILTYLCYFQCFNFAAKKLMKENSGEVAVQN
jgi:hypothetical protein